MWYVEVMYADDQWWNELRVTLPGNQVREYDTYAQAAAAAATYRLLNPEIKATRIVETK